MQFPLIKLKNASVVAESIDDNSTILDDINLEINDGEFLSIVGPSGSGKTSLLFTMTGLFEHSKGSVSFRHKRKDGTIVYLPLRTYSDYFRARVGFSFEEPSLYRNLTAKENLEYFFTLYRKKTKKAEEKTSELLSDFGISSLKDKKASELSGGEAKRLDLACSLVNDPKLLFLDEPTTNLDPLSQKLIWDKIKELNNKGITIIATTHFVNEIETLSDRILFIDKGKIIDLMTPEGLIKKYSSSQEVTIETMFDDLSIMQGLISKELGNHISNLRIFEGKIILITSDARKLIDLVLDLAQKNRIGLVSLNYTRLSLDQIFYFSGMEKEK